MIAESQFSNDQAQSGQRPTIGDCLNALKRPLFDTPTNGERAGDARACDEIEFG